jgi:hypothetical protein
VRLAVALAVAVLMPSSAQAFTARGSVGEAYVLGAKKGERLTLERHGHVVVRGRADRFGSKIFRALRPGAYTVRGRRLRVLSQASNPPRSFFKQTKLRAGLNYVQVRDGIELAMTVRLPAGKTLSDGPFPTVVEYSGYQTAAPHDLLSSIVASLSGRQVKPDPLVPASSTAVGALIAPLLDFAVVSVQMRGSGCSGGAFDLFGLPTTFDGYDAIEAVAAQKWVKGGKVGMVGISFSGITQLFTAGTRPPHLAAITPMSVTDDVYTGTGFPGGIENSGFAKTWAKERLDDARPAPRGGQPWARALVKAGDRHCRANQRLRLQTLDILAEYKRHQFRDAIFEPRSPGAWMRRITAPAFLIGQFQDEQTGGHFPESLAGLASNPKVWITLQNGVHADSLGPVSITRWVEFLKLYVANEIPRVPESVLGLSGALYQYLADAPAAPVEQSRFARMTDVAAARALFEQDPRVRLLMDNGAGPQGPGSIGPAWELGYDAWPVREAQPTTFFLGPGGTLGADRPADSTEASYVADPGARPRQTLPGDGAEDAWKAQPPYDWAPIAAGKGLGFVTAPLASDVVIAGPSSLDLQLRSSALDTDLQVTLSEVRPDGNETYVQNGWLRASHRKLDAARSTVLDPVPTHLRADAEPLPTATFSMVRVPIFPVAHAFRAGSRIRVTIAAAGGDRPRWDFATVDTGTATNTIELGGSQLVLPVLPGVTAEGTPLPAPTALRGEPNRTYVPASNGG